MFTSMEVVRIYNPNGEGQGIVKVRKDINPHTIVTYEENFIIREFCTVMIPGEAFLIDENYASFKERVEIAKLIDVDYDRS